MNFITRFINWIKSIGKPKKKSLPERNNTYRRKFIQDIKHINEDEFLDDGLLRKLNEEVSYAIEEKKSRRMDYATLENVMKKYIDTFVKKVSKKVQNPPMVVTMKKEEMIKHALDFFKSIDEDLYNQAKKIILQQDKNIILNIYNLHNVEDFSKKNKFNLQEYTHTGSVHSNNAHATIHVPIQEETPRFVSKNILKEDECFLSDLYTLVHEISHLFDFDLSTTAASKAEIASNKRRSRVKMTRELLGESTSSAFEELLTKYLLKNTNYPKGAMEYEIKRRRESSFFDARLVYSKLILAKEKTAHGPITEEFLREYGEKNSLSMNFIKNMVNDIIEDQNDMLYELRYAIAGIISPKIVKLYESTSPITLKKYLNCVKNNDFKGALYLLGVDYHNLNNIVITLNEGDRNYGEK